MYLNFEVKMFINLALKIMRFILYGVKNLKNNIQT